MIYTVTLNPSLDYIAYTSDIRYGKTNRSHDERIIPGGKGLNVSIVLNRLGEKTTAIAFSGGFTGEHLKNLLKESGVDCDFIEVEGATTRINVKMVTDRVTEMNGSGLTFTEKEKSALIEKIRNLNKDDLLVLSGTLPKGVDTNFYAKLMEAAPCETVLDTNGWALLEGLKFKPLFIKPNDEEMGDILGIENPGEKDIYESAVKLQKLGARNVLISLGKDGGALLTEDGTFVTSKAAEIDSNVSSYTVGAGDSMVAGFIHALNIFSDPLDQLEYALCMGTSSVVSPFLAEKETAEKLFQSLKGNTDGNL